MRAKAEEAITADLGVYPIAPAADNRAAAARFAATQGLTIQAVRVPAQVVRHLRVATVDVPAAAAAECVAAAAECAVAAVVECAAVAVVDMPAAAGTGNL